MYECIPFTLYLQIWNLLFALTYKLLGMEIERHKAFPGLTEFFAYFTLAFDNAMGGISTPIVNSDIYEAGYGWYMTHLIWFFWFVN